LRRPAVQDCLAYCCPALCPVAETCPCGRRLHRRPHRASFPGSAWKRTAGPALPALPRGGASVGSGFPGGAWEPGSSVGDAIASYRAPSVLFGGTLPPGPVRGPARNTIPPGDHYVLRPRVARADTPVSSARRRVEDVINGRFSGEDYGTGVEKWAHIPIVMSDASERCRVGRGTRPTPQDSPQGSLPSRVGLVPRPTLQNLAQGESSGRKRLPTPSREFTSLCRSPRGATRPCARRSWDGRRARGTGRCESPGRPARARWGHAAGWARSGLRG